MATTATMRRKINNEVRERNKKFPSHLCLSRAIFHACVISKERKWELKVNAEEGKEMLPRNGTRKEGERGEGKFNRKSQVILLKEDSLRWGRAGICVG
jgi:hypothetical protein